MPERPDLEYVVPILDRALSGRTIREVTVGDPVVLRLAVRGGPELLEGRRIERVTRRAHTVCLHLDAEISIAVAPMLAGRFALKPVDKKPTKDTVISWSLDDDQALWLRDDVRMAKVTVIPHERWEVVPGLAKVGIDVLDPKAFTLTAFKKLAKKRRDQVKNFLRDKSALDSFGNAYADETLFAAGIHPKARVKELTDDQLAKLFAAIVSVLTEARDTIAERKPPIDKKIRDFLKVRNRGGEPCPVCGTTIRAAGVNGHDAFFCPQCQPDAKQRGFVDWRRVGKD